MTATLTTVRKSSASSVRSGGAHRPRRQVSLDGPPTRHRPPRSGRGSPTASLARPPKFSPKPPLGYAAVPTRACVVSRPAPTYRLTDRGLTVIIIAGLMIMVAAAAVVGLTAIQVTSASYVPSGSAHSIQR